MTVARDCIQRYIEEKSKLKKILKNHRICLTTDTWTSKQNLNYMSLTAHWIDDHWKLQKRILNFCSVADHKGETLGKRVEECLLDWRTDRLFTVTVDNASSNDKLIEHLKGVCEDWNGVVLKNKFLHVRCCAHIVNLVVKSGLEEHNHSIEKIRTKEFDILDYWKVSSNKYPVLSLLAKDVLAVLASTVPSESAFSTGGRVIDPLRCSLSTHTVEASICAQSWLETSQSKVSAREAAEEIQTYEKIREGYSFGN
jgi:hypothetical protein